MQDAFDDILAANEHYASSFALQGLAAPAARGLGVLTCIDSRIEPLPMLGLEPGDAKIFRNAGARVTADVLRTLAIASHLLEVRRIMVVSHTDCAMATTDDQLRERIRLANPAARIEQLDLRAAGTDPHATLQADLSLLRSSGVLAPGTVVGAFEYDVHSGRLLPIEDDAA
jgi:carbonic anhydrase